MKTYITVSPRELKAVDLFCVKEKSDPRVNLRDVHVEVKNSKLNFIGTNGRTMFVISGGKVDSDDVTFRINSDVIKSLKAPAKNNMPVDIVYDSDKDIIKVGQAGVTTEGYANSKDCIAVAWKSVIPEKFTPTAGIFNIALFENFTKAAKLLNVSLVCYLSQNEIMKSVGIVVSSKDNAKSDVDFIGVIAGLNIETPDEVDTSDYLPR